MSVPIHVRSKHDTLKIELKDMFNISVIRAKEDPHNMEVIKDYRHIEIRERLCDSQKQLTDIPSMPYL